MLEFGLRAAITHRAIVDKQPVALTSAGSSVVFNKYADLAPQTTPLTELVDPDSIAMSTATPVTVTLNEYGTAVVTTLKLTELSYSQVNTAAAEMVSWNAADSIDIIVRDVARAGTNRLTGTAGAVDATPRAVNALLATDVISSRLVRTAVTKLRVGNSQPVKDGNLYAAYVHPDVSYDLRTETGAAAWRDPHVYSAPSAIWAGEIGAYEGAFFIETPRAYEDTGGSGNAKVARSLFFGKQALAEVVAVEPEIRLGPVTDKLMRFRPIGWYGLGGWAIFRQESIYRVETGTSVA